MLHTILLFRRVLYRLESLPWLRKPNSLCSLATNLMARPVLKKKFLQRFNSQKTLFYRLIIKKHWTDFFSVLPTVGKDGQIDWIALKRTMPAPIPQQAGTARILNTAEPTIVPTPMSPSVMNVPMAFTKSSGAEVAAAMNVAPATSFDIESAANSLITHFYSFHKFILIYNFKIKQTEIVLFFTDWADLKDPYFNRIL